MFKFLALGLSATSTLIAACVGSAAVAAGGTFVVMKMANGEKKIVYKEKPGT